MSMDGGRNPDAPVSGRLPRHLGIIMDGNGRWAQERGLPRLAGHQAGTDKVHEVAEMCIDLGIPVLTLYVFSTENWERPMDEVEHLFRLAEDCVCAELPNMQRNGVRLQLMGKRDGLPAPFLQALDRAIRETRGNTRLCLNLAMNYGGRDELVEAIQSILADGVPGEAVDEALVSGYLYCPGVPDLDLVIRTGGEWRLSNFMLWRSARAVFWSTPVYWPDFHIEHLQEGLRMYAQQGSR